VNKTLTFNIREGEEGRVDKAAVLHGVPRSVFSLDKTVIAINGKSAKKSAKVKDGDEVNLCWEEEVFENIEGEDIPLNILYEDEAILVINKESGMVVHPGAGNRNGTVVNALIHRYGEFFCAGEDDDEDSVRPGIVHRLDKDTSGVMVIAKNQKAHSALQKQFAAHTTEKYYIAIAKGNFSENRGKVEKRIARSERDRKLFEVTDSKTRGKDAITHYKVLRNYPGYAFLRIKLETGRTHQIRVHMKSIGHPLLGDPLYSRKDEKFPEAKLMLHSLSLEITHPVTGERMKFVAPLPSRFPEVLRSL
jgi:pseudouridine synthase, RluA family